MNHRMRSIMTLTIAAALTSCTLAQTGVQSGGAGHAGHGASALPVQGKEYSFSAQGPLTTGWQKFTFTNTGKELHHFQIARLPDGMTLAGFLAEAQKGPGVEALLDFVGGVGIVAPGGSATSIVNLDKPGVYVELCFVPDAKGVPHLALGMVNAFEVKAATGAPAAPEPRADVSVSLEDFGIQIPKDIRPGAQTWRVTNKGPESHEMMIFKIAPGKTVNDLMAMLGDPKAAPAGMPMGGMQALAKGRSGFVELKLDAGDYVLVCFIPSPAHGGKAHAELGMVRPFTVK